MKRRSCLRWTVLVAANVLFLFVLTLYRDGNAAPRADREPFANSVRQRAEMIAQLKEINTQLKQQNALLSSGKLKVVVADGKR